MLTRFSYISHNTYMHMEGISGMEGKRGSSPTLLLTRLGYICALAEHESEFKQRQGQLQDRYS